MFSEQQKEKKNTSQQIHLTMLLFQIFSSRYLYGSTKINTHLIKKSAKKRKKKENETGRKMGVVVNHEHLLNRYTRKYKVGPGSVFYLPHGDYVFKLLSWV